MFAGISQQLKKLEKKEIKRRDRMERQNTVHVRDVEQDNFYSVQDGGARSRGNVSSSSGSLQSRHGDNDELIVNSSAPQATVYVDPPTSDKFDFVNVRPRSSYEPPGRLPALGANKPKTREYRLPTARPLMF